MNNALKMIRDLREAVKAAAQQHCAAFCDICGSQCSEAVLSVLDGELRMAEQLEKLESFYSNETCPAANEYEVNKFRSSEG